MDGQQLPDDPTLTRLHSIIDDDDLKKLQTVFGASGRGRRPTLPSFRLTNKFILQLYYLRGNAPWEELADFAQKFIELDLRRLRSLLENTYKTASGINDRVKLNTFLKTEQASFVGVNLSAAGITRSSILSLLPQCPPLIMTNVMLIELDKFRNKERLSSAWLKDAVFALTGVVVKDNIFSKEMKVLWSEYRKKSKAQSRAPENFREFLAGKSFLPTTTSADISLDETDRQAALATTPENPKKRSRLSQDMPSTPQSQGMLIRKLNGRTNDLEDDLRDKEETIKTLQQLISEGNKKVLDLAALNDNLQFVNSKLENEIEEMRKRLQETKDSLSKVRHSAFYKRLKRKESKLKREEEHMKDRKDGKAEQQIADLKANVKSLQTRLSRSKISVAAVRREKDQLKMINSQLKDDFLNLPEKRNLPTREEGSQKFTKDVVKCIIQLIGEAEVSAKNCGTVIKIVSDNLFHIHLDPRDLPSERTSLRFADQGHVLAKHQLAEALMNTQHSDLHSDGTTKDHRKYVGHQLTVDSGQTLSCGFTPVCQENTETLVDVAYGILRELADVYDSDEGDTVFKEMLQNLSGLMSDRASVMKSFNRAFSEKRKNIIETDVDMEFLHCNAHFLLGLSSACEKVMKEWESEQTVALGRDASGNFSSFASSSETSTARLIRTACDILGPRGDEKNGCRDSWEAFCSLQNISSSITSFKGNRFNNLFQAAAAVHFHREQVTDFLENFLPSLNRKQISVLQDLRCDILDCAMVAVGVVYEKITGPYWLLMSQELHYLDFYKHVCCMHETLETWSADSSQMYRSDTPPLFGLHVKTSVFPVLYQASPERQDNIRKALRKLCSSFKDVVERQLADFLPGGRYHDVQSPELRNRLAHSKMTNLIGEECFGDLDFSIFKRRHSSVHHHSTVNMLKRNKTSAWFATKSEVEQQQLLSVASKKSYSMRASHREMQREVVARRKNILQAQKEEKELRKRKELEKKTVLVAAVKEQGGPCLTVKSLGILVNSRSTQREKMEAMKNEIRYQKTVLGANSPLLKLTCSYDVLRSNLEQYLRTGSDSWGLQTNNLTPDDLSDNETDDEFTVTEDGSTTFGEYEFTKQGQNVAVYFDNDFYVGQVVLCKSSDIGSVRFMDKCGLKNNAYRWPQIDCVEDVESVFVIAHDFELSTTNGRMWQVQDEPKIKNLYRLYKELYC